MTNPANQGVLKNPSLYLIYWGSDWTRGFSTMSPLGTTYSSTQYQNYISAYLNTVLSPNDANFVSTREFGAVPPSSVTGVWVDDSDDPGPSTSVTDAEIRSETQRAQYHFGDFNGGSAYAPDGNAIFVVLLPPGHDAENFPTKPKQNACSYHNVTQELHVNNNLFLPVLLPAATFISFSYQPDSRSCWQYQADGNTSDDTFGHGYFDGVGRVLGHEIAETITDPFTGGWRDRDVSGGNENGDLCDSTNTNIGSASQYFYAQAYWSNDIDGCEMGDRPVLDIVNTITFDDTVVNERSAPKTLVVSNSGNADMTGISVSLSGKEFRYDSGSCPRRLHPGGECSFSYVFTPSETGHFEGTVTVKTDLASFGTTLEGDATLFTFDPIRIRPDSIAPTPVRGSNIASVVFENQSARKQVIQSIDLRGGDADEFHISTIPGHTCLGGFNTDGFCFQDIVFTPFRRGWRATELHVTTLYDTGNDTGWETREYSSIIAGYGNGSSFSMASDGLRGGVLSFKHAEGLGAASAVRRSVTITSDGELPLRLNGITADGDYTIERTDCPFELAVGAACHAVVVDVPAHYESQRGLLTITGDFDGGATSTPLSGGVGGSWLAIDTDRIDFGDVHAHTRSAFRVQLTPLESEDVDINAITTDGGFSYTTNCASEIDEICFVDVTLDTSEIGSRTGTLTVATSALNGTRRIPITARVIIEPTAIVANPVVAVLGAGEVANAFVLKAWLAGPDSRGIAGETLSFTVGATALCEAQTASNGVAECSILGDVNKMRAVIQQGGYFVQYRGSPTRLPSSARGKLANVAGTIIV